MTTGHDRGAAHPANRDTETLHRLGYKQELNRTLGLFSNFAVAFSYLSVSTGIFSLFALGIQTGGPAFFWSWPLVCLGQLFVALSFAELASHYPLAGSVYQWSKRVASPGLGWMIGWFYLGATILTITAVAFTLSQTLPFIFNWPTDANTGIKIALVTILICTIVNISGVRLLAMINNTGVAAEIIGMVVFALVLLVASHHQSLSILVNTAGTEHTPGAGSGYVGVFLSAMFMSLFVVYGFDAAGTVAEETVNAQKEAPRGILIALGTSFVAGGLFLIAAIMAIKNLPYIMTKSTAPLQDIINSAFGSTGGKLYLAVASIAIFVCAMSVQAAAIRLMFSMGRDGRLPFSRVWASVNPQRGTPIAAAIVTAVLGCLPLLAVQQLGVIATGAAGLIYLSYWLTCVVVFVARRRGWPERTDVYFSLGRWGNVVNILAIAYGGAMLINFAWFRPATNPNLGVGFTSLAKVPILGGFPIFEFSVALLLIIGSIYWLTVQRHRTQTQQDLSGTDASVA